MRTLKAVVIGSGVLTASALLGPGSVAAQCSGGTTTAGYYARDGSYQPGGCATLGTSQPSQLPPLGQSPGGSSNTLNTAASPVAPLAAPSGNPANNRGVLGSTPNTPNNGPGLGAGIVNPGGLLSTSGLGTDTALGIRGAETPSNLAYPGGSLGTGGSVTGTAVTGGLATAPGLNGLGNLASGDPLGTLPATGNGAGAGTTNSLTSAPNGLTSQIALDGGSAYGYSLPASPAPSGTSAPGR
jgi:hypothetical protein